MNTTKPNIILIMTDQQRADTIGAWGMEHMITPSLDRLARSGISFTQTYCPGATCVASRAAMFTGMYPHNTGVYSFDRWGEHRNWVQLLSENGYRCVNIGKMHFTPRDINGGFHERVIVENPTNMAHAKGDVDDDWGKYLHFHGQKRPIQRHLTDTDWDSKFQGVPWHLEERFHSDVFIGNSAVSWIRNYAGDAPVFLQVGFTGPHEPWDPLPRHLERYDGITPPARIFREGELEEKPPQQKAVRNHHATADHESRIRIEDASEDDIDRMRRHYYAKITTVDEQIGRVIDALDEAGFLDDSIVVFCSDHGEMLGDHQLSYKWLMYDQIVRVPLIIWRPSNENQSSDEGYTIDELVSLMDIGPTILDAAGLIQPTYHEGRSLMPYLEGGSPDEREFVFSEDNYLIMMRSKTHKVVYYIGQEDGELYDLSEDPHELRNLWNDRDYAQTKNQLLNSLLEWLAGSAYWCAGYHRDKSEIYSMRWPEEDSYNLHGRKNAKRPDPDPG